MATADLRNLEQPRNLDQPPMRPPAPERERAAGETVEWVSGGAPAVAVGGLATAVLAIVGLAHVFPVHLAAVASLVLGGAFLAAGARLTVGFARLLAQTSGMSEGRMDWGGGASAPFLAGCTGIVLGILALLGVVPEVLMAVSAIVFGAGLVSAGGASARLRSLCLQHCFGEHEVSRRVAGEMAAATTGAQFLVGLAAVVLGIIALAGIHTPTLALVAFLCLGIASLLGGTAVAGRVAALFPH
jgi:hypothetical protein